MDYFIVEMDYAFNIYIEELKFLNWPHYPNTNFCVECRLEAMIKHYGNLLRRVIGLRFRLFTFLISKISLNMG